MWHLWGSGEGAARPPRTLARVRVVSGHAILAARGVQARRAISRQEETFFPLQLLGAETGNPTQRTGASQGRTLTLAVPLAQGRASSDPGCL